MSQTGKRKHFPKSDAISDLIATTTTEPAKKKRNDKSWGQMLRAVSPEDICSHLYRLDCLDNGQKDPKGIYTVEKVGVRHRLLVGKTGYVKDIYSKATYSVFEDFRWFKVTFPELLQYIVKNKGNPKLKAADRESIATFVEHVPLGNSEKGTKGIRHAADCQFSKKKTDDKRVCFAFDCIIRDGGDANVRVANETDKHFTYFLTHFNKEAVTAFSKGGIFCEAYKAHYGQYYVIPVLGE